LSTAPRSKADFHEDSEWLWDVIWRIEDKSEASGVKMLRGLYLACESELSSGTGAILSDFQKLLVADAKLKVFVFMRSRQSIENTHIPMLQEAIHAYKNGLGKSRLLVVAWDYNRKGQEFLSWRYNSSTEELVEVPRAS
jgi:hypothetical protein